jgi:hypothetical protein
MTQWHIAISTFTKFDPFSVYWRRFMISLKTIFFVQSHTWAITIQNRTTHGRSLFEGATF